MPYLVPSESEFNALVARVEALESQVTPGEAPPAPTGVAVQPDSSNDTWMLVSWNHSPGAEHYSDFRKDPGASEFNGSLTSGTWEPGHSFAMSLGSQYGAYELYIVAVNEYGQSEPSDIVSFNYFPPNPPPTNLRLQYVSNGTGVELTWDRPDTGDDPQYYTVYSKVPGATSYTITGSAYEPNRTLTRQLDSGPGEYSFYVTASTNYSQSVQSNIITAYA